MKISETVQNASDITMAIFKEKLKEKGISPSELANRFDEDRNVVKDWLNGSMPYPVFLQLCAMLKLKAGDVFNMTRERLAELKKTAKEAGHNASDKDSDADAVDARTQSDGADVSDAASDANDDGDWPDSSVHTEDSGTVSDDSEQSSQVGKDPWVGLDNTSKATDNNGSIDDEDDSELDSHIATVKKEKAPFVDEDSPEIDFSKPENPPFDIKDTGLKGVDALLLEWNNIKRAALESHPDITEERVKKLFAKYPSPRKLGSDIVGIVFSTRDKARKFTNDGYLNDLQGEANDRGYNVTFKPLSDDEQTDPEF